jgi:hypothetical protein
MKSICPTKVSRPIRVPIVQKIHISFMIALQRDFVQLLHHVRYLLPKPTAAHQPAWNAVRAMSAIPATVAVVAVSPFSA